MQACAGAAAAAVVVAVTAAAGATSAWRHADRKGTRKPPCCVHPLRAAKAKWKRKRKHAKPQMQTNELRDRTRARMSGPKRLTLLMRPTARNGLHRVFAAAARSRADRVLL